MLEKKRSPFTAVAALAAGGDEVEEVTETFKHEEGQGSECDMLRCNYTHLVHSGD